MKNKVKTGRTTRMLLDALRLCHDGQAVYVVAANIADSARLNRMLDTLGRTEDEKDGPAFVKVETGWSLGNLNWETLTLVGAYPNCVVLMDHYAIETHFSRMLEMLTRYDLPVTKEDK